MSQQLLKIRETRASEITSRYEIDKEAIGVLTPELSPVDYLLSLLKNGHNQEATNFLAHALPKREAIWWACMSTREALAANAEDPNYKVALESAEKWVNEPTEENRRAAEKAAIKTGHQHAASWTAQAVFWCTGSIVAADQTAVPAADYLYSKAIVGAVVLAAVHVDVEKIDKVLQNFLKAGIDLAKG